MNNYAYGALDKTITTRLAKHVIAAARVLGFFLSVLMQMRFVLMRSYVQSASLKASYDIYFLIKRQMLE